MSLCPACFERLAVEGALRSMQTMYYDYSRLAAMLIVLGIPCFFLGVFTGGGALYYGAKGLVQVREMGRSWSTWRWLIVFLGGPLEILASLFSIIGVLKAA
jgi:hypothetical protein